MLVYSGGDANKNTVDLKTTQLRLDFYRRKSIRAIQNDMVFSRLTDTTYFPKHHGQIIKGYKYPAIIDDANTYSEGIDPNGAHISNGNLYGSSRDIGKITDKFPVLTEVGGKVNRVGLSREVIESKVFDYGMYMEYTKDSMDFDTDSELYQHFTEELMIAINQVIEDNLQYNLIDNAGTKYFTGAATSLATMTGEGSTISEVSFNDLRKLGIMLDQNKTPTSTKVITGSTSVDTKTVSNARFVFISHELRPTLEDMKDPHNNNAFTPVRQYAGQTYTMPKEIGAIGHFRFVVVDNMMHWAGNATSGSEVGAAVTDNNTLYKNTNGRYDVYPMLVVGDKSFATYGLFGTGKNKMPKVQFISDKPGPETATSAEPYGRTGFMSVQYKTGFLPLREERIALLHTCIKK